MKKILGLFLFTTALIGNSPTMAQMVIDNSLTPEQLVQDVLVGQGVVVSNITFTGDLVQIGYFDAFNANFAIEEGIVMSSGNVNDVPDIGDAFASTNVGVVGDADLDVVSSLATQDAVILEFDFVPTGDSIKFDYVFGSEEYPEFVNAAFNDVFAFIISGPGFAGPFTNGGENIALIPGTVTPITIDNVNDGLNAQYYIDNDNGTDPNGIVFDGYTVTLTALAEVECGETYHLKLAIADAGDGIFDSGVFLAANSFSSNAVEVNITTASGTPQNGGGWIVEGCTPATIDFTRPAGATDVPLAVAIEISGSAINGTDYNGVPDTVFFAIGDTTVTISIEALNDNFVETGDSIVLTVFSVNLCGDTTESTGTIYIFDAGSYVYNAVAPEDVTVLCATDSVLLVATATGGNPEYTFLWDNGMQGDSIWVQPNSDTTFVVSVEDECNTIALQDEVSIFYNVNPDPVVELTGDTIFDCAPTTILLTASGTGGLQPYTYNWSNAATGATNNIVLNSDATFYVSIEDACGIQSNTDTIHIIQNVVPVSTLQVTPDVTLYCPGEQAFLTGIATGGTPPYTYVWNTAAVGSSVTVQPTQTTDYTISVTDNCFVGIVDQTITVTVEPYTPPTINLDNATVICPEDMVVLSPVVSDGLSPFVYNWDDGTINETNTVYPSATTSYTVTVTDFCGNTATDNADIDVPVYSPLVVTILGGTSADSLIICELWSDTIWTAVTGGLSPYSYTWDGASVDGFYINSDTAVIAANYELPPDSTVVATYTVQVMDQCQTEETANIIVQILSCDIVQPAVFSPETDFEGTTDFCGQKLGNGQFNLPCLNLYPGNVVKIWSRWGRKVYEQENYHLNPWDGGKRATGVYYYVVEIPGGKEPVTGYFHILR